MGRRKKSSKRGKLAVPSGAPSPPVKPKKTRRSRRNPAPKKPKTARLNVINFFIGRKVGKIKLTKDLLNDKVLVNRLWEEENQEAKNQ